MKIPVESIIVKDRIRRATQDKVDKLAKSISEIGLIQPITIDSDYNLVAGLHRLLACKKLGYTEIEFTIKDFEDKDTQRLAEIDENYVRCELTALERAQTIVERDKLILKLKRHKYPDEKKHQTETIFGDSLIGVKIPDEIKKEIYGTELENQKTNLVIFSYLSDEKKIEVLEEKLLNPDKTYKEIIDEVRSGKREYKDVLISTKVTRKTYDTFKKNEAESGQTIYEQANIVLTDFAAWLEGKLDHVIPAELEEVFENTIKLSRDDYQWTKSGASI